MGQRGPIPKADHDRQRSPAPLAVQVLESQAENVREVPDPPKGLGLRAQSREVWVKLWESDVARAWQEVDLPIVERYITYYDQWLRAMRELEVHGYTDTGSQGQQVMSAAAKYVDSLERKMGDLENRLGLTPLARARLGLTIGEAQITAHHLNDMLLRKKRH